LANLQSCKEQARRDADEAKQSTLYYLDQSLKDGEEIMAVKKERDELLQKESEAREWALELLSVAKKEHDRKLVLRKDSWLLRSKRVRTPR
jgi:hypothetical protein